MVTREEGGARGGDGIGPSPRCLHYVGAREAEPGVVAWKKLAVLGEASDEGKRRYSKPGPCICSSLKRRRVYQMFLLPSSIRAPPVRSFVARGGTRRGELRRSSYRRTLYPGDPKAFMYEELWPVLPAHPMTRGGTH